ncbi:hypothetical protein ACFW6F_10440 [Streptomyces sp. NPDC058746]|uniref:hypothetical protein n=1 Tax=Streptomyces sp. NPDC058746 TaxID=3346622 RepID=UPI0036AC3421
MGRAATAAYYAETLRQIDAGWSTEQIGRAWDRNPVPERYTLDLWFVRDSEPGEDEDEEL